MRGIQGEIARKREIEIKYKRIWADKIANYCMFKSTKEPGKGVFLAKPTHTLTKTYSNSYYKQTFIYIECKDKT